MALPVFEIFEDTAPRQWEAEMISCLQAESAGTVFLPRFIAFMNFTILNELGIEGSLEIDTCMRDRVLEMGIGSVTSAFTEDDHKAATNLIFAMLACAPDLFYTNAAEALGVEPRELNEEERSCIREWAGRLDESERTRLMFPEDKSVVLTEFWIDMFACTPDLLIDSLGNELGVDSSALGESERACLQAWVMDLDEDGLLVMMFPESNPNAALQLRFELFACVSELLPPGFTEDRIEEPV